MSRDKPSQERAPLCPICGVRHWAREPHVFGKAAKAKAAKAATKKSGKRR
jgi:hypothetical protein